LNVAYHLLLLVAYFIQTSSTVTGLQSMLDKCAEIAEVLEFNARKCHCIAVGKMYNSKIAPMNVDSNTVDWCETTKYLGVYLQGGKSIIFNGFKA